MSFDRHCCFPSVLFLARQCKLQLETLKNWRVSLGCRKCLDNDFLLGSKDIIMLNFYADWCRFSQMLKPIYDKAADKLGENVSCTPFTYLSSAVISTGQSITGKSELRYWQLVIVVLEKDLNVFFVEDLCTNPFHVTKYPTIKIIRYGMVNLSGSF